MSSAAPLPRLTKVRIILIRNQ